MTPRDLSRAVADSDIHSNRTLTLWRNNREVNLPVSVGEMPRQVALASSQEIVVVRGHENSVVSVAFSPDGRTLATGSYDKTARLWEVVSGKELAVLRGHDESVDSVAFSPDGRTLATGSYDKTVRLWEVASGKELAVLRGHDESVESVAFSPDGRSLAAGLWDHTARLWPVGQGLIDLACARVYDLPLSERNKERFGIENEWCTPEVSSALRTKLYMDGPNAAPPPGTAAR